MVSSLGVYAFLATAPIIAVIYFTYTTYLRNVEEAQKVFRHRAKMNSAARSGSYSEDMEKEEQAA